MAEQAATADRRNEPGGAITKEVLVEILQATPDFVAMADENGEMLFLNAGARAMIGLPAASDGLGFEIPPEARQAGTYRRPEWAKRKLLEEGFPTAREHGIWRGETALYDADGNEVAISHIVLAHFDADGRAVRYSTIMRDITAEKRQQRALAVYQAVFQDCRDAILLLDTDGTVVEANPAACQLFTAPGVETLIGTAMARLVPQEPGGGTPSADLLQNQITRTRKSGSASFEARLAGLTGQDFPAAIQLSRVVSESVTRLVAVVRDVTTRQARYEAIFNHTYQFTGLLTPDGLALEANDTALKFAGTSRSKVIGRYLWETPWFQNTADPESELREAVGRAARGEFVRYEREIVGADGPRVIDFSIRPFADARGEITMLIPEGRDITELVAARRQLQELAYRDQVTGLPNRRAYHDHMAELLGRAAGGQRRTAVLVVKMERFPAIVRAFGHQVAEEAVRAFAARIQVSLPQGSYLAYVSEAQFAVVLADLANPGLARRAANRIWQELQQPLALQGAQLQRQAWIGVALAPDHGRSSEELLRQGEIAMDNGRDSDGGGVWFADPDSAERGARRLSLTEQLRAALDRNQVSVAYQPLVAPQGGALVGLEALARWHDPEAGWVPPETFVPLAVESGLARQLGEQVLHQVLADLAAWQRAGYALPRVAVNVTRQELRDPVLSTQLLAALRDHGLSPGVLELDVPESLFAELAEGPRHLLTQLRRSGVGVAIDDFGAGACPLVRLGQLPADRLKLARAVLAQAPEADGEAALLDSLAALAGGFGLGVVGKGVESAQQRSRLAACGAGAAQGFHIAEPMSPGAAAEYLSASG